MADIVFGFTVAPVDAPGTLDAALYDEVMADCALGHGLGYESAWFLEHHFTDYFPTPSPLLHMAYTAARFPTLGLGTCVLVTPWYHPIRLAEEIAMLSILSQAPLHIGIGRGTAKLEYDAWGVDQELARELFKESVDVIRLAHSGQPFQFQGRSLQMNRRVRMRPEPNRARIHLYGAIGSPQSAAMMAEYGLPPLCVANFPLPIMESVVDQWNAAARGTQARGHKTLMIQAYIADTDDEARALVKRYVPPFFQVQARHYEADLDAYKGIKGYEQFSKFFGNLKKMGDPEKMDPWIDLQLCGTPETARRQLQAYVDMGYDAFIIQVATYEVPRRVRHEMLTRFARDVAPAFNSSFKSRRAAE
jgi:alkanesulfonate monooxygenase SsuD/methylene tetrahydromethanopterin reductase-like flavin-dependent oxidoreductase (luciferase family)